MGLAIGKRTKMKGLLALVIAAGLIGAFSAGMLAQRPADDVVAQVNGEVISERELYEEMLRQNGEQVLNQMVTDLLIRQALAEASVAVSDEAVQAELERLASQLVEGITLEEAL